MDGIGARPPYYAKKDFTNYHLPDEWEIVRDIELYPFKDVLVFRRMVEFLGVIPINLKGNMWELEELIENMIDLNRPQKGGNGAWHAKIKLIDQDGEEFTKTFQSIPTTRKFQMSTHDKNGLGFGIQMDNLSNKSKTDSENSFTVFEVRSSDEESSLANNRFTKANEYDVVPPPITGNPLTPRADISFAGLDEYAFRNKIIESKTTETNMTVSTTNEASIVKPKSINETVVSKSKINRDEVIIEDWTSDDEDDVCAVKTVSSVKPNVTQAVRSQTDESDCGFYDQKSPEPRVKNVVNTRKREVKPVWDYGKRVNHQNFSKKLKYPHAKRTFNLSAVLTRAGLVNTNRSNVSTARLISIVRPVYTVRPVSTARPLASKIGQSNSVIRPKHPRLDIVRPKASNTPIKRSYFTQPIYRPKDLKPDVKTFGVKNMTTVGTKTVVSKGKVESVLKKAKWVWKPKMNYQDRVYKYNGSYMLKKFEYGTLEILLQDHAVVDSGCSSHMTGNKAYLSDYEDLNGGFVAFGSDPKGGSIVKLISMNLRMDRSSPGKYNSSMVFPMANLKYSDKHNMVAFLKKPNESEGTSLRYALTHNPTIYDSLVKQFWQTATVKTLANGTQQLVASIDSKVYTITEASVRSKLQLADAIGIHNLSDAEIYAGLATLGYVTKGDIVPFLPVMLAGATVDQGEGSAQPAEPHHTPVDPIPSTSQPPHPSPLHHLPYQSPYQSPPHSLPQSSPHFSLPRSYEVPLPEGNTSGSAKDSMQLKELMVLVPTLVTRVTSLEKELQETKQTLGNAVLKLVKKVKSLETALKRKSKKVLISESEGEESEDQGRKIQDIDDDPLVSLVRESMKEKSTDFVTPTKALGEAQEEEISPTILEAAKTLSKVASQGFSKEKSTDKGKRYRRRARFMAKKIDTGLDAEEVINTGREEINTGIEEVSTGSTKVDSGTTSKKGQREGKAPMVEEDIQATHKTKEQMRQEEAGLEEAINLQAQLIDDKVVPAIGEKIAKVKDEEQSKRTRKRKTALKDRKGYNVDMSGTIKRRSETDIKRNQ
ncbi:hypothetical protein Tco_1571330 [Tanacetum coccineum]